tara:strand:- start:298 stop:450 length:153 start_codon:yes stop_codon:yes gene_type:complete
MGELEKALDDMHKALCKLNQKYLADALIGYVYDYADEFELTELINEEQTP